MEEAKHEGMKVETLLAQERNNDHLKRKKYKILKNILLISLVFLLHFTSYMVCFVFLFDLYTKLIGKHPDCLNQLH